jgi:hypothetical protein
MFLIKLTVEVSYKYIFKKYFLFYKLIQLACQIKLQAIKNKL